MGCFDYIKNIFTISFNPNGGTVQPTTKTVPEDFTLGSSGDLPVPVRAGYIFDGWFDDIQGGSRISANDEMTNDIELFAHWRVDESAKARIIAQPQGANVCYGSEYALVVRATGTNLRFQWYRNDLPVPGATGAAYFIENAGNSDFGTYYVTVQAASGEAVKSIPTYIGLAHQLPEHLTLESVPDVEFIKGRDYNFKAKTYDDVVLYTWSAKNGKAVFWPKTGLDVRVTFTGTGDEVILVTLTHSCGERVVEYPVSILEHETSAPDNTTDNEGALAGAGVDDRLKAFPNPVSDILTLTGLRQGATIRIYTLTGTTIATYNVSDYKSETTMARIANPRQQGSKTTMGSKTTDYKSETTMTINMTDYKPGLYYINVDGETLKIIKK